jgi:hypothetical protein
MKLKFPIYRDISLVDALGRVCRVEVVIEQTADFVKYFPDGKKCIFRFFREKVASSDIFELILLLDNHEPYGFHYHDKLPNDHDSRVRIMTLNWSEAWIVFDEKVKELLK